MSLITPPSVQKLQTALHAKAKESPNFRFYALYGKLYPKDVLAFAYAEQREWTGKLSSTSKPTEQSDGKKSVARRVVDGAKAPSHQDVAGSSGGGNRRARKESWKHDFWDVRLVGATLLKRAAPIWARFRRRSGYRASNQDASASCGEEVERILKQIRQRWPKVRIILRADSGFCRNSRLQRMITRAMREAKHEHQRTGEAARVFAEFSYRTRKSWSRSQTGGSQSRVSGERREPPFRGDLVPAESWGAAALYEKTYCARGEMENRIKEMLSFLPIA